MEFCLEEDHFTDEMSAASASAYSLTQSDEVNTGSTSDLRSHLDEMQTALEDKGEAVDESAKIRFDSTRGDLSTARRYSNSSQAFSTAYADQDDITLDPAVFIPARREPIVTLEQDVVGAASSVSTAVEGAVSPVSTAVAGSISCYSLPPSETSVEVPEITEGDKLLTVDAYLEKLHALQREAEESANPVDQYGRRFPLAQELREDDTQRSYEVDRRQ